MSKNKYRVNPFLAAIVKFGMRIFCYYHRMTASTTPEIRNRKVPYLLLSNHSGELDPFILSNFLKHVPNYVSSDAILRDKVIGTLFTWLGAMPKKKGVKDSVIIREIMKQVQIGGRPCIFPEAARTWDGTTLYIDPSIAKLIKLLNIPVVTARMKGAYFYNPRWSRSFRRSSVEIDFHQIIDGGEARNMTQDDIMALVNDKLQHDDIEYQRQRKQPIQSDKRAEFLDLVLFQCPDCKRYEGFTSGGNQLACKSCGDITHVDQYGFFEKQNGHNLVFDNPRDWLDWQARNWVKHIAQRIEQPDDAILFETDEVEVQLADNQLRMDKLGTGKVAFRKNRIDVIYNGTQESLLFADIEFLGPQFQERLECTIGKKAYRFISTKTMEPGIKWELAICAIWQIQGAHLKVSPYFRAMLEDELG